MKTNFFLTVALVFISLQTFAQGGWNLCNTPPLSGRIDDIFMVNTQIGYAINSEGKTLKTFDGGNNWYQIWDVFPYGRSVEFINEQKGFVGSLYMTPSFNILSRTLDGGVNWTDLTTVIDGRARKGICGLSIPDSNTIYGCGNWFQDSAYIVKSIDGGNTWSFIDMHTYASHLIDMYFLNKDTGFATGSSPLPTETGIILYTTDGGQTWSTKFQDTVVAPEWCWKIQHLTDQIYFASLQTSTSGRILKSTDGGMNWSIFLTPLPAVGGGLQGVGFIDSLHGWIGGFPTSSSFSFETHDGGMTWDTINVCPGMNRVFKVNDTLVFACGTNIWKYTSSGTGITPVIPEMIPNASIKCYPNPANNNLAVEMVLNVKTQARITIHDEIGRRIKLIDNFNKSKGVYRYSINTENLPRGIYHVILKTHEDDQTVKVMVTH